MKKYLALILSVLFVLSFAASAFAIHAEIPSETQAVVAKGGTQITLGGEIRTRGWYLDNISGTKMPAKAEENAWYDQRVRLSVDAKVSPNIEGFVMLETGTSDTYKWGGLDYKPEALKINEAWILYTGSGLFGFNSGLKIGHMPLALGEKQFFDHTKYGDDAIVFFMDPIKPLHIGLLTFKGAEASSAVNGNANDLDAYVGLVVFKINDKNTVGANFTYLNQSVADFKLMNLGLHAKGDAGVVGYKGELDIQAGSVGDPKTKFRGYAAMLGVNFKVNPVNVRASAAYGSGDKDATDDKNNAFQTFLTGGGAAGGSSDQHYTLVYEYQVASAAGSTGAGLSNTTYANLGVDFTPTKDLTASVDGYFLRASKVASGSKNAGWEVDAKVKYAVAKNLTYQVDAGYFKAGSFYEDSMGVADAKGAIVLRHALTLSF